MRIMIDTNILISAALFPNSVPAKAYLKAVAFPNRGLVCKQNITELNRIFNRKFPNRLADLNAFLAYALVSLELVDTPELENPSEEKIRDAKDRAILRAALHAEADVLLTGDTDFLESGLEEPRIMTASEFLTM